MARMYPEILDAIALLEDEDVRADCLIYLRNIDTNAEVVKKVNEILALQDRCLRCGHKLSHFDHIDNESGENVTETYCSNCDLIL